jgi:hypothetical protein
MTLFDTSNKKPPGNFPGGFFHFSLKSSKGGRMSIRQFKFVLGALVLLYSFAQATPCDQQLLEVVRKSFIHQYHPEFKRCQLLPKGETSQLCGITSLANLVNLNLLPHSKALAKTDLAKTIASDALAFQRMKQQEGDRWFSLIGMFTHQLGELSDEILIKMNLPYKTAVRANTLADLWVRPRDLTNPHGAIWEIRFTPKEGSQETQHHFITVLGFDEKSKTVTFADPLNPKFIKSGKAVYPKNFKEEESEIEILLEKENRMPELTDGAEGAYHVVGTITLK